MKSASRRSNQELRTRKALLDSARRLMQQGRLPNMDEVTKEALVSRPTAYRYFRSIDLLLNEAAIDDAVETVTGGLDTSASSDPEERLLAAEAAMHRSCCDHEAQLRVMLANAINHDPADESVPSRQNRRLPLIQAELAPARDRFSDATYQRLCHTLALIFGPEVMIVFRDVLRVDETAAREVKTWAVRMLLRGALAER